MPVSLAEPQPPSAGLAAPPQLREAISTLREIMAVYTSSLLQDDSLNPTPSSSAGDDFTAVLAAALDPALEMCSKMSEMRTSAWDRAVFGVNCMEACLGALEGFGFTAERCRVLEEEEAGHVETLTGEHVSWLSGRGFGGRANPTTLHLQFEHLLKDSGLEPILSALHSKDADVSPVLQTPPTRALTQLPTSIDSALPPPHSVTPNPSIVHRDLLNLPLDHRPALLASSVPPTTPIRSVYPSCRAGSRFEGVCRGMGGGHE